MNTVINFQSDKECFTHYVVNIIEFKDWVSKKLRTNGNKLYLLMTGELPITKSPREIFITSSPTDIEQYFEFVCMGQPLWIQQFNESDYADCLGYLNDLYENDTPAKEVHRSLN